MALANGPFAKFSIPSNLDFNPLILGLRYEDLVWRPAGALIIFIFFKVWFQGMIHSLAINQPFADLQTPLGKTWKSLQRNHHVTPTNCLGFPLWSPWEVGNGLILLGINSVLFPQQFFKVNFSFPETPLQLPAARNAIAEAFRKEDLREHYPPFASRFGIFTPFLATNGDDRQKEGSFGNWQAPVDMIYANLSNCVNLTSQQFSFPAVERTINDIPVIEVGIGELSIPNCEIVGRPITLCPSVNGTKSIDFYYTGTCGSWSLIASTTDDPEDCSLSDHWLIHEVRTNYTSAPELLGNGSTIVTVESQPSREATACLPAFWQVKEIPALVTFHSNRTILPQDEVGVLSDWFILYIILNSTSLFPSESEESSFRTAYNQQLSEAIQESATLTDQFLNSASFPSRFTSLVDFLGLGLDLRADFVFTAIFTLYLSETRLFWPDEASGTLVDGWKAITLPIASLSALVFMFIAAFVVVFVLTFPTKGRTQKYRVPRSLDSIGMYLTYIYSSPLLQEIAKVGDARMNYRTIGFHLQNVIGPPARFKLGWVRSPFDFSTATYTIARVEQCMGDGELGSLPNPPAIPPSASEERLPEAPELPPPPTVSH
ncbi:hypothetical protein ABW19_dt0201523 [Dactylella cylindrospora]|nr:hypothetical protein ABW19_dt0201523 [Dactylella cylindrospora]